VKVCVNELPGEMFPLLNELSSAVTVWVWLPMFDQVTVLLTPITTTIDPGSNE